jgi:hypothetical protein
MNINTMRDHGSFMLNNSFPSYNHMFKYKTISAQISAIQSIKMDDQDINFWYNTNGIQTFELVHIYKISTKI